MSTPPLQGIRVLEMAQNVAVPMGTRILASMGAEVIKVESSKRVDPVRTVWFTENAATGAFWNKGGYGHEQNAGKRGIALDLTTRPGQDLFKRLVQQSDVVVENFTPRVTANWGLAYEDLKKVNPSIVMLSNTGYGRGGPWENYKALGMSLEGTSGIAHVTGYPGRPPMRSGLAYPDTPTGYMAAFAILAALSHRRRTGRGQWIDMSMYEVCVSLLPEATMDFSINGREATRRGNAHPSLAPYGAYRCQGRDQWVTIAVASEEEWKSLCRTMGKPTLAGDPRFADSASRCGHRAEIDALVEEWTSQRRRDEIVATLQAAGIAAGGALTNREVMLDRHMKAREFFEHVTYTGEMKDLGSRVLPGRPWLMTERGTPARRPSPALGEHTDEVLTELLGLTQAELSDLAKQGITSKAPRGIPPPRNLSADELLAQGSIVEYDPAYRERLGLRQPES